MRIPAADSKRPLRRRRGFALAAALFALMVIGALVGGAFFAARQEMRVGLNHRWSEQASGAAEAGLMAALAEGSGGRWSTVAAGDSLPFAGSLSSGTGRYAGAVHRLNGELFLVRATGFDMAGQSGRTVGALARLARPSIRAFAALTIRGALELAGSAWVDGRDSPPSGWTDCPAPGQDSLPGLARLDSAVGDTSLLARAGLDWEALASRANRTYTGRVGPLVPGPLLAGAACDTSAQDNWGEPLRGGAEARCRDHFPIIVVDGDLVLGGGRGQGILMVRGDLDVRGAAEFVGLIVVTGRLRIAEGGGLLVGAALVLNGGTEPSSLGDGSVVRLSTCALNAVSGPAAAAKAFRDRFWLELY